MNKVAVLLIGILVICFSCTKADVPSVKSTLVDISGNTYLIETIGTQTWMLDDLITDKYNTGEDINNYIHGRYSFYEVETGKLCPKGWHVPSSYEWQVLYYYFKDNELLPQLGNLGYWWSSSTLVEGYDSPQAWAWYQNQEYEMPKTYVELKEAYLSVRCIKDN